jgi:hypothetical protein
MLVLLLTPGKYYLIDKKNRFIESREERILKLQAMWKLRQAKTSVNKLNNDEDPFQSEIMKDFKEIIFRLRRLRIQMEKTNQSKAEQKLFKEHTNINMDFETVGFEKLEQYMNLSETERMVGNKDTEQDFWIQKIITR